MPLLLKNNYNKWLHKKASNTFSIAGFSSFYFVTVLPGTRMPTLITRPTPLRQLGGRLLFVFTCTTF